MITVVLDRTGSIPLYIQLYSGIKELILKGSLKEGEKLPSVRTLASSLATKFLIDAVINVDGSVIVYAAALMVGMSIGNIVMRAVAARVGAALNILVQSRFRYRSQ